MKYVFLCAVALVILVLGYVAAAERPKFEFEDISRKIDMKKWGHVPNPPVFEDPMGACEVQDLSLKRVKRELKKRMVECVDCKVKRDYQLALIDAIKDKTPVMSDDDLVRYLAWEQEHPPVEAVEAAPENVAAPPSSIADEAVPSPLQEQKEDL